MLWRHFQARGREYGEQYGLCNDFAHGLAAAAGVRGYDMFI